MRGGISLEMADDFVYRISTVKEWEELQKNGSVFGGDLDKTSGFIHLSKLDQVFPHTFVFCLLKRSSMCVCVNPFVLYLNVWEYWIISIFIVQVKQTLQNFFLNTKVDLYLLQIDAKKVCIYILYVCTCLEGYLLLYAVTDAFGWSSSIRSNFVEIKKCKMNCFKYLY